MQDIFHDLKQEMAAEPDDTLDLEGDDEPMGRRGDDSNIFIQSSNK